MWLLSVFPECKQPAMNPIWKWVGPHEKEMSHNVTYIFFVVFVCRQTLQRRDIFSPRLGEAAAPQHFPVGSGGGRGGDRRVFFLKWCRVVATPAELKLFITVSRLRMKKHFALKN